MESSLQRASLATVQSLEGIKRGIAQAQQSSHDARDALIETLRIQLRVARSNLKRATESLQPKQPSAGETPCSCCGVVKAATHVLALFAHGFGSLLGAEGFNPSVATSNLQHKQQVRLLQESCAWQLSFKHWHVASGVSTSPPFMLRCNPQRSSACSAHSLSDYIE